MSDSDEEALETMLDLLAGDLEDSQKHLRWRQSALADSVRKYNEAVQHIRYLKNDARVVLMTEYQSAISIRANRLVNISEAQEELAKNEAEVNKLKSDILAAQEALQEARMQVAYHPTNTAKILEFPNAHSRRDPSADPE